MRTKHFGIASIILVVTTLLFMFISGFHTRGFIDGLFYAGMLLLCVSLFLIIFADGAFSIMGHSFRRFNFMIATKRMKETMAEDELYQRSRAVITKRKIPFSLPLLIISLVAVLIATIWGYLL